MAKQKCYTNPHRTHAFPHLETHWHLVEDVVGPLAPRVRDYPDLLQQVRVALGPRQPAAVIHLELRELPEPRAVVVPDGLGVAEALQQRVGGDHLACRSDSFGKAVGKLIGELVRR